MPRKVPEYDDVDHVFTAPEPKHARNTYRDTTRYVWEMRIVSPTCWSIEDIEDLIDEFPYLTFYIVYLKAEDSGDEGCEFGVDIICTEDDICALMKYVIWGDYVRREDFYRKHICKELLFDRIKEHGWYMHGWYVYDAEEFLE